MVSLITSHDTKYCDSIFDGKKTYKEMYEYYKKKLLQLKINMKKD